MKSPSPLGRVIRARLRATDWTQSGLAAAVNVSEKHVSQVVCGSAGISPELAAEIEWHTGLNAEHLLRLDMRDRLAAARAELRPVTG